MRSVFDKEENACLKDCEIMRSGFCESSSFETSNSCFLCKKFY
jgi:hypothetical protein